MDKFTLYAAQFLSFTERFGAKGHTACSGCGVALAVRQVYKALEGTGAEIDKAQWQIPWEESVIVSSASLAGGSQPALLTIEKKGGEKAALFICFDNESAPGKIDAEALQKKLPAMASASGCPYVATACPSHPFDLIEKVRRAWGTSGNAYLHILCPCPAGWGFAAENTVKIGRRAVESLVFPLYEITQGLYKITCDEKAPQSVAAYVKGQTRFAGWNDKKIAALQEKVAEAFTALKGKAQQAL